VSYLITFLALLAMYYFIFRSSSKWCESRGYTLGISFIFAVGTFVFTGILSAVLMLYK
jgi:hypothetical protein